MPSARDSVTIVIGSVLLASCFIAGFLLVQGNSAPPQPVRAEASSIPAATVTASAIAATSHDPSLDRLVIKRARYGMLPDGNIADVTQKVASFVTPTGLELHVDNNTFGDPAPGGDKRLSVEYLANGIPHTRTFNEGETLKIPFTPGPARLLIKKAAYGDLPNGTSTDVTEKVADAAALDHLSIDASNDNFGDPAPGIVKKLLVDYTFDGKTRSTTIDEGQTLKILAGEQ